MTLRKLLSNKLVELKNQNGSTYEDIMEVSGCSRSTVRYALNGGERVSMENFEKLLKALGVSIISIEVEFEDDWI